MFSSSSTTITRINNERTLQAELAAFEKRYNGYPFGSIDFWIFAVLLLGCQLPRMLLIDQNFSERLRTLVTISLLVLYIALYVFLSTRLHRNGVNAEGRISDKRVQENVGNKKLPNQFYVQYSYKVDNVLYENDSNVWFEIDEATYDHESLIPIKYIPNDPEICVPSVTLYYRDLWLSREGILSVLRRTTICSILFFGSLLFFKWVFDHVIGWDSAKQLGSFMLSHVLAYTIVFVVLFCAFHWKRQRKERFHVVISSSNTSVIDDSSQVDVEQTGKCFYA